MTACGNISFTLNKIYGEEQCENLQFGVLSLRSQEKNKISEVGEKETSDTMISQVWYDKAGLDEC